MEQTVVVTLPPQLAFVLVEQAKKKGIDPESMALELLRRQLLPTGLPAPIDDWERRLFDAAIDGGVSVSNSVLSSEELYE